MKTLGRVLLILCIVVLTLTIMAQDNLAPITVDNVSELEPVIERMSDDFDIQGGALSADGSLMALLDIDNQVIQVTDIGTEEVLLEIPEEGYPEVMLFSPDNNQLTVLTDEGSNVFDIETGDLVESLGFYIPLAYSADGSTSMAIKLDEETEELLLEFARDGEILSEVALPGFSEALPAMSADGTTAAVPFEKSVYILDVENPEFGDPFATVEEGEDWEVINTVGLNSDGSVVAFSDQQYMGYVHDVESGDLLYEIDNTENSDYIDFLVFNSDDTLLYAVNYNTYRILDAATGEELNALGHNIEGRMAVFGVADNIILGASYNGVVAYGVEAE